MSYFAQPQFGEHEVHLTILVSSTRKALAESARRKGRTIHEEAEHIIKSHLVASGEEDA